MAIAPRNVVKKIRQDKTTLRIQFVDTHNTASFREKAESVDAVRETDAVCSMRRTITRTRVQATVPSIPQGRTDTRNNTELYRSQFNPTPLPPVAAGRTSTTCIEPFLGPPKQMLAEPSHDATTVPSTSFPIHSPQITPPLRY